MTRPMRYLVAAVAAAPFVAWGVYRLAKELGFLDPPWNREHEQRRTILAALFALLLFGAVFLFGHANAWPRAWAIFGLIDGLALLFFAGAGLVAGWRLWKIRHPKPPVAVADPSDEPPLA